jgi:hypothetical protein
MKGGSTLKKFMTVTVILCIAGTFLLTGCKKPGVVEEKPEAPSPQTELPVPQGLPVQGEAPSAPPAVRQVLDEQVGSRWKGVEITVKEKKEEGAQTFTVEIPLGGEALVEGTPLKILLLGFVPDFSMGADTITTKSLDDVNPAAKITVSEGEQVLFTGWSFRDFPGMHSFDDPRYTVRLTRAIPVEE